MCNERFRDLALKVPKVGVKILWFRNNLKRVPVVTPGPNSVFASGYDSKKIYFSFV